MDMETATSDATAAGAAPTLSSPPADLVIRATRPGDAEGITELRDLPKFRWGTASLPFQTPEEVRKAIEARAPADLSIVAILEDRIVGQAGLKRYEGRRAHAAHLG